MDRFAPFGQADCESEVELLKSDYSDLYFGEIPFNRAALREQTYLIIGRRGAGKTALAQYFSFQTALPNPVYIDVDEPAVYQQVLSEIASRVSEAREIAIPRLQKVWEYVLWCLIFSHTRTHSTNIAEVCDANCSVGRPSNIIDRTIDRMLKFLRDSEEQPIDEQVNQLLRDERLQSAKLEVLQVAARQPIIIAFDTLEKYDISDKALMNAMAALVQFAAHFNLNYSERGIHLKMFVSGEVFPYLEEEALQNPLKSVKDPVYLFWRPKDLLRLISWRFYQYLKSHNLLCKSSQGQINWTNHRDVFDRMWTPYFGKQLTNRRDLAEDTFSYVLRHTQMRPRQLILLCNAIAEHARDAGRFPQLSPVDIRTGVKNVERKLATEIINSFSSVYPHVPRIVDALMKVPMLFTGNVLDQRAKQSASEWPPGTYSPSGFRRLVAELGIVGVVSKRDENAGYIQADFEYSRRGRLTITHREECVIHPMFYSRFNVEFNSPSRVIPIPAEREEDDDDDRFL